MARKMKPPLPLLHPRRPRGSERKLREHGCGTGIPEIFWHRVAVNSILILRWRGSRSSPVVGGGLDGALQVPLGADPVPARLPDELPVERQQLAVAGVSQDCPGVAIFRPRRIPFDLIRSQKANQFRTDFPISRRNFERFFVRMYLMKESPVVPEKQRVPRVRLQHLSVVRPNRALATAITL